MFLLVLTACSEEKTQSQGELAAIAAKGYYDDLLKGKYEEFVNSRFQTDSIPTGYHEQLVANARMFIGQQTEEHGGIKDVRILNANADTIHNTANVFLAFEYGDNSTEQIVVPMVKSKGKWLMR